MGSLTLLSHAPYLYLLTTFYGIRPTTAVSCLAIDILTTYLPFRLLRQSSATRIYYPPDVLVFNRSVINDFAIRTYTSLLGAAIYGVIVFGSFGSWLPVYLVVHFDGIKDITAAHTDILPKLIALALPVGYAAREFIFTPAVGAQPDSRDSITASFNPETASLGETIMWNLWGYSKRTRILIKRTATLVAISGLHTWLQTYVAVQGTEFYGAAGWSGVWAVAAMVTGAAYWWVGDVEGVLC